MSVLNIRLNMRPCQHRPIESETLALLAVLASAHNEIDLPWKATASDRDNDCIVEFQATHALSETLSSCSVGPTLAQPRAPLTLLAARFTDCSWFVCCVARPSVGMLRHARQHESQQTVSAMQVG